MKPAPTLLLAVLSASLGGCLQDEDIKLDFVTLEPVERDDGWERSTPEAEGFDREALEAVYEAFFSEEAFPTANALLVVRHGRLVAEAYARDPEGVTALHDLQSATKSITSILAGIALDEGVLPSVDTPVYDLLPESFDDDVRKRSMTLHHVLTMTTGLDFDNREDTLPFYNDTGSSLEYVLHRPLVAEPGAEWWYHDGAPQLVSGMIQARTGQTAAQFAEAHLFGPLGIDETRWEQHDDGLTFGAFGLWLTPRDMAKIGQMMLQDGAWEGEQIVSPSWVSLSTRPISSPEYGYYWWWWAELAAFEASGHGGQTIFVKPDADLVVVITADSYAATGDLGEWFPQLYWWILDALVDPPAPAGRPAGQPPEGHRVPGAGGGTGTGGA